MQYHWQMIGLAGQRGHLPIARIYGILIAHPG